MYTKDGITWTGVSGHDSNDWSSVTYGDGKFVAVACRGANNRVMYSRNGINWTGVASSDDSIFWHAVTYGNGKFVAVASYDGKKKVMYSEDAINWTGVRSSDSLNYWNAITYGNGKFVAVAYGYASEGSGHKVMYSEDAITWTGTASSNDSNMWYSVTYGDGKFVAVGSDPYYGGSNQVMVLEAPEDRTRLHFNGDPVVIDRGQTLSVSRLTSGLFSRVGTSRHFTSEEPSDSFGYENGTLWLNPSNAKLSIYHDGDWNQLN